MRLIVLISFATVACITCESQNIFQRSIGEAFVSDFAVDVVQTLDNGYIMTGQAYLYSGLFINKTTPQGNTLWSRIYDTPREARGVSIVQTNDGGCIVAGKAGIIINSTSDILVMRIDSFGDTLWTRAYRLPADLNESAKDIELTNDNGLVITGSTSSSASDSGDVFLMKLDLNGDTLWTKTYGGSGADYGNSVAQTNDGGFIVAGTTNSYGIAAYDAYVIKTDNLGNVEWTRTYGGIGNDIATSVLQNSDGTYLVCGRTRSFGAGGEDVFALKLDINGNRIWARTYGGTGRDRCFKVDKTNDGGYILAGATSSFGAAGDVLLLKLDSAGFQQWAKAYGGTVLDGYLMPHIGVQQTSDGGFIIAGTTNSYGIAAYDAYVIKTDNLGNVEWTRTYGGIGNDIATSVLQNSDGSYLVCGRTNSFGAGGEDVFALKLAANGNRIWARTYGGVAEDKCFNADETNDGGYILAGSTSSFGAAGDVLLLKLDSAGFQQWAKAYGGTVLDGYLMPHIGVQQTSDGGFIIATSERSFSGETWANIYMIKTDASGSSGCNESDTMLAVSYFPPFLVDSGVVVGSGFVRVSVQVDVYDVTPPDTLLCYTGVEDYPVSNQPGIKVYPNPTGGKFRVEGLELGVIEVHDLYGRLVLKTEETEIDLSSYPAGVYFVKVGDYCQKLVLSK